MNMMNVPVTASDPIASDACGQHPIVRLLKGAIKGTSTKPTCCKYLCHTLQNFASHYRRRGL